MGVMMQSTIRPRRANDALRELLAAANSRQLSAAAFATGLSVQKLELYASGAASLDGVEAQRVAEFFLRGAFFIKASRRKLRGQ
jgi:hypothetical protein